MSTSDNVPLQEFNSKNAKRIAGNTLLGCISAVPALFIVFLFVSMIFYVFLDFNLSAGIAFNTIFAYSCLVVPIVIIVISVILLKRKHENFRKAVQLSWAGLIGVGALLVVVSSAIGGERLTRTPTPEPGQEAQVETAAARIVLDFAATAQVQTETALAQIPTNTPTETVPPTETSTPTPLPTPTHTPVPLTCLDIERANKSMTDIQWQSYQKSIVGRSFIFDGIVRDVHETRIWLEDRYCTHWLTYVYLYGVGNLSAINKGQVLVGFGTVRSAYDFLGFNIEIYVTNLQ